MKYRLFILILALFLNGCSNHFPETPFNLDGISFISPEGWKITDRKMVKQSGFNVSCQRKGYGSGGIFIASWINAIVPLDEYMKKYREEFEKNVLMKTATVNFDEPVDSVFNSIPCIASTYSAKILRVKTHGEVYSFYCGSKTVMLVFQESIDESEKNKAGFDKIKSTFRCRSDVGLSVVRY